MTGMRKVLVERDLIGKMNLFPKINKIFLNFCSKTFFFIQKLCTKTIRRAPLVRKINTLGEPPPKKEKGEVICFNETQ